MSKETLIDQIFDKDIDMRGRTIWMYGDVDDDLLKKFSKHMHMLEKGSGEIIIKMCSQGGHVSSGWGIYDLIKSSRHHVKVIVESKCESMATIIIQAADERVIHQNARMMIHVGTEEYPEDHAETVKRWQGWSQKEEKKANGVYLSRIKEKKPRFTMAKLTELTRFDTILTPKEAIELGLLDKVVGE